MHRLAWFWIVAAALGCSHAETPGSAPDAHRAGGADARAVSELDAAPPAPRYLCRQAPPAGAPVPVSPKLPAGGCPTLVPGHNKITSGGHARDFILVVPADRTPDEKLPVLFMWHWIGGSADKFLEKGEVQAATDDQRFLAIIPSARGASVVGTSFDTKWPFDISQLPSRMDEEFMFFDDMLACVEAQYPVETSCVSSVGVSAGALFTDQLVQARSTTLASFISLSGGVADTIIKPWTGATRKLPGVVLWGGDGPPAMDGNKDILGCLGVGMDFSVASRALEDGLAADGHFIVECRHNCGHVEPPLTPPAGESKYAGMWEFALNHPYWLAAGASPFLDHGLPDTLPEWCSIGPGTSTPRSGGGCPAAENPCAF